MHRDTLAPVTPRFLAGLGACRPLRDHVQRAIRARQPPRAIPPPPVPSSRDLLLESEDPTCCLRLHYEVLPPKDACEPRLEATWNTPTIASDECIRM